MICRTATIACAALVLVACDQQNPLELPGSTEWDRNVVLAEASEPVLEWLVAEGERVTRDQPLLRLDGSRLDAAVAAARARLNESEALLAEFVAGPRVETISRARAELASTEAALVEAELEFEREAELLDRNLTSESNVDRARAARDQRQAAVAAAVAQLDELLAGTRTEQILQAEARVAANQASLQELMLTRERLEVRAPRDGRVDSLPFRPGDQPRTGDALVSLLVGDAPIARVFVPANVRAIFEEGDEFEIRVEGVSDTYRARLRSIRSEASFTPYYALTGDDASRLVYRAELLFEGETAAELPAGLPLVATPIGVSLFND